MCICEKDDYSLEWNLIDQGKELPEKILQKRVERHKKAIINRISVLEVDLVDDLPGKLFVDN